MGLNPKGVKIAKCPYCHSNNIIFLSDVDHDERYALVSFNVKNNAPEKDVYLPVNVYGCKDCSYVFMNIETLPIENINKD